MRDEEFRRLRWRCRRGMLELDIILNRFLDNHASSLTDIQIAALARFLDYSDPDMLNVLMGRLSTNDAEIDHLVGMVC
ncbi:MULTISPECIES: FAD assembly factor SdhE [Candidatus Ichthyocystis]|uniref:FAD assembly factor SdhE n=1 Tax=Candidatus Ichthyocystis TaxID=2929841 RepID=UPI000B033A01|nr:MULTISPECIES: succinate dehydrogenase assembly factor 2 [Ichthyocystis]